MQQQPRQQSSSQLETVLLAGLVHVQPFFPFSILSQLEQSSTQHTNIACMHSCVNNATYRVVAPPSIGPVHLVLLTVYSDAQVECQRVG